MLTNWFGLRVLGSTLVVAMSLAVSGCCGSGGGGEYPVAQWNFEGDCTDDLCGFTATTGSATRTTAFTPGEHAMLLAAGTEVDHPLAVSVPYGPEYISMVARCDDGAHLEVDELLADSTPTGGSDAGRADSGHGDAGTIAPPPGYRAATVTLTPTPTPGQNWSRVNRTFDNTTASNAGTGFYTPQNAVATDLRIRAVGGSCTVDQISYGYQSYGGGGCY